MAFAGLSNPGGGPSVFHQAQPFLDQPFDIFEWYQHFQSCARYFLDHAQHTGAVQAMAAFINIKLPCQRSHHPVLSSRPAASPPGAGPGAVPLPGPGMPGPSRTTGNLSLGLPQAHQLPQPQPFNHVSLIPYIRRLVATGFDHSSVLHGFFGDDWSSGVGPLHEQERRNYLFAAKSETWLKVKNSYDMEDHQTVPFLRPLQTVDEKEILAAESKWSEWLAMQDWMLGPRAPEAQQGGGASGRQRGANVKQEED